ncbi:MAG TPA: PspC domain-containing protein [Candidatus Limnocylindrales bacterium]|nr:PspC domain-containing protein [Candidatus Limnocylindrales bacterium]
MNDRLYRSRTDRMLAGVAGGLAEHWDADPSLIRLVWALLTIFTGGIALVVYIVMALILPDGPATTADWPGDPHHEARRVARREARSGGGRTAGVVFGVLLMVLGAWFLIDELFPAFDTDVFWPIALIVLGIALLGMAVRPGRDRSAPGRPPANGDGTVEPGQPAGAGS